MADPRVREVYMGIPPMSLLRNARARAFYGDFQALFDIDFTVEEGETVAIIGANGAGKTTFLRAVAGVLATAPDMVVFDGAADRRCRAARDRARGHRHGAGGAQAVPEPDRRGESAARRPCAAGPGRGRSNRLRAVPDAGRAARAPGPALSGGQQQMAAIGRALMSNPRAALVRRAVASASRRW